MKFGLAVGDSRHYVLYEIMPRHFVETAAKNGVPSSLVQSIFDELVQSGESVISKVMNELPAAFPQELAESIVVGVRARMHLLQGSAARAAR